MPSDRRCPCMFQSEAISCLMRVSHAAHSAFFWQWKQKKTKPALINEVQFHLACPAVIVLFKTSPALPFGKPALFPVCMLACRVAFLGLGVQTPNQADWGMHCLSSGSVTLFWTGLVLEILLHSVLIFQSPLIFLQALNDVVDNRIVGINLEQ